MRARSGGRARGVAVDVLGRHGTRSRDPGSTSLGLDDDQRAGRGHARLLRGGRERRGIRPRRSPARSRRTSQGVHRAEESASRFDPAMPPLRRHDRVGGRPLPRWHPISISGYQSGRPARPPPGARLHAQGRAHVRRAGCRRGLEVDDFAPGSRSSSTRRSISSRSRKYRAARRIWARELRDRFARATSARG